MFEDCSNHSLSDDNKYIKSKLYIYIRSPESQSFVAFCAHDKVTQKIRAIKQQGETTFSLWRSLRFKYNVKLAPQYRAACHHPLKWRGIQLIILHYSLCLSMYWSDKETLSSHMKTSSFPASSLLLHRPKTLHKMIPCLACLECIFVNFSFLHKSIDLCEFVL